MVPTDDNGPRRGSWLARVRAWLESDKLLPDARSQSRPTPTAPEPTMPPRDWAITRMRRRIEYENTILNHTHADASLLLLLEELEEWRKRRTGAGAKKELRFAAQDLHTQDSASGDAIITVNDFRFKGEQFRVEVETERATAGAEPTRGKLRLFQGDKLMVAARLRRDDTAAIHWTGLEIESLEPGSWVSHVSDMDEQIRYARETPLLQTELQRLVDGADDPSRSR